MACGLFNYNHIQAWRLQQPGRPCARRLHQPGQQHAQADIRSKTQALTANICTRAEECTQAVDPVIQYIIAQATTCTKCASMAVADLRRHLSRKHLPGMLCLLGTVYQGLLSPLCLQLGNSLASIAQLIRFGLLHLHLQHMLCMWLEFCSMQEQKWRSEMLIKP